MGTLELLRKRKETRELPRLQDRIVEQQQLIASLLDEEHDYPGNTYSGRGIVTLAGGPRYFPGGYVLCRLLRDLGCRLPIQVWFLNRSEMDPHMQALMEGAGPDISCVDAEVFLRGEPRRLGGWQCKVWSIMRCPFREVLFLDSDQVPIADPTYLFDELEYQRTGAVLWPDLLTDGGWDIAATAFEAAGLPIPEGSVEFFDQGRNRIKLRGGYTPVESGQLLIDKARHWIPLQLCRLLNDHSEFWYRFVYGDKSTFLLSWLRTGALFSMPPMCGWFGSNAGGGFLQRDFSGRGLFQHRCQPTTKLSLTKRNRHAPGFVHAESVDQYLNELRSLWHGSVRYPDPSWKMRRLPMEIGMWNDIVVSNEYRLPERFEAEDVIVDIGGHVGMFAEECLQRGAGKVVSVEPDNENFANLVANLAKWGERSVRVHGAAWYVDGWLHLERGSHTGEHYVRSQGDGQLCRAIPLASVLELAGGPVRLLKLDCEAAEWELLERCSLAGVAAVCGEWHTTGTERQREHLEPTLLSHGFTSIEVGRNPTCPDVLGLFWASRDTRNN